MTLPEDVLADWASAPGDAKAQEAYRQIKVALQQSDLLKQREIDVYLQGSYRNRTHIRANSDVDVVAELQTPYSYDIDALSETQKAIFKAAYLDDPYGFVEFKRDVRQSLVDYFGQENVTDGNKCIKIRGNARRSNADALPCLEHRKVVGFSGQDWNYLQGIKFFTRDENRLVINWPKIHFRNGAKKNSKTNDRFKHLVRICKHMRDVLAEWDFPPSLAPSYFIECLLYNVPNNSFTTSYAVSLSTVLAYLEAVDLSTFVCVNEQDPLFGTDNGWNVDDARTFIEYLVGLNEVEVV